jgi:hypothetical protein
MDCPRGPARFGPPPCDGSSVLKDETAGAQGSPVCSTRDQRHVSGEHGCRTAGRERPKADAGCHAVPKGARPFCCEYREDRCRETGIVLTACAGSGVALGKSRLQGSQASLNSNCQKNRRKQFSSRTTWHIACQRRRQRFPTVRTVG